MEAERQTRPLATTRSAVRDGSVTGDSPSGGRLRTTLLLALTITVAFSSLLVIALFPVQPQVGLRRDHQGVLLAVTEGGAAHRAGLRAGDRLVSVDGLDVTTFPRPERGLHMWEEVRFEYERDGQRLDGTSRMGLRDYLRHRSWVAIWTRSGDDRLQHLIVSMLSDVFTVVVSCGLSLLILLRFPSTPAWTALVIANVGFCFGRWAHLRMFSPWGFAVYELIDLFAIGYLVAVLEWPRRKPLFVRFPWLLSLPWLLGLSNSLLGAVRGLVWHRLVPVEEPDRVWDRLLLIENVLDAVPWPLAIVALVHSWRIGRASDRAALRWVVAGAVATFGTLILTGDLPYMLTGRPLVLVEFAAVFFPVTLVLALAHHGAAGVKLALSRRLTHGALTALVLATIAGLFGVTLAVLDRVGLQDQAWLTGLVAGAALFATWQALRRLRERAPDSPDVLRRKRLAAMEAAENRMAEQRDLPSLFQELSWACRDLFGVGHGHVFYAEDEASERLARVSSSAAGTRIDVESLDRKHPILEAALSEPDGLSPQQLDRREPKPLWSEGVRKFMSDLDLELVMPLAGGGGLTGLIALGPQPGRTPYDDDDRLLLRTLGRHGMRFAEFLLARGSESGLGRPTRLGRFELLEELGRGGMGVVWRARDESLGREVAIKLLPAEALASSRALERFRTVEAKAVARLEHPNICRLYELGEAEEGPYLVMELLDGRSLDRVLLEDGPLTTAAALRLTREVAVGLAHASERGIVHRDVKPMNLLLTREGAVKLLDFGLALLEGEATVTRTGDVVGTLRYMAPERIRGQRGDVRSDVYSLGLTLFELLTGDSAFVGLGAAEIVALHERGEPLESRVDAAELPDAVGQLIKDCTAADPARRPASHLELVSRLDALEV